MQERLNRAKDAQANMVDGIVVPKKKAKSKPAAKVILPKNMLEFINEGSSSSKD